MDTVPPCGRPTSRAPASVWKIAVITPNAAATETRFITAALSATTGARNRTVSSSTESATTNPMTIHSRSSSRTEMSENVGSTPVVYTPSGTVSRTRRTRSVVPSADGARVGCTTITAVSPAAFGIG